MPTKIDAAEEALKRVQGRLETLLGIRRNDPFPFDTALALLRDVRQGDFFLAQLVPVGAVSRLQSQFDQVKTSIRNLGSSSLRSFLFSRWREIGGEGSLAFVLSPLIWAERVKELNEHQELLDSEFVNAEDSAALLIDWGSAFARIESIWKDKVTDGIWTPARIPESIAMWNRYGVGQSVRIDGSNSFLVSWADQGPGGHDLAQTTEINQPLIGPDAIEYNGVDNQKLITPTHPDFGLVNGIAIFVVLDTTEMGTNKVLASKWTSVSKGEWVLFTRHFAGSFGCGFIISNAAMTAVFEVEAEQINDGMLHLVQIIYDGSFIRLRIDDGIEFVEPAPDFRVYDSTTDVVVGAYNTFAGFTQMGLREFLVLKATPPADIIVETRGYIGIEHGVPV